MPVKMLQEQLVSHFYWHNVAFALTVTVTGYVCASNRTQKNYIWTDNKNYFADSNCPT